MAEHANHPSFLELDRLVLGAQRSSVTANHIRECDACQGYLDQVTADRPVARWAIDLSTQQPKANRVYWSWWKWAGGFAGAATAVTAVVMLVAIPAGDPVQITAKGDPAVGVYVKRHDRVSLWDGRSEVIPGDTLRLKVIPSGYEHLTVLSPETREGESGNLTRLHEAVVDPDKEIVLPVAWRVDEEMGDEEIIVVLSREPLPGEVTLEEIEVASSQSRHLWFTRLVLKKAQGSGRK